MLNYKGRHLRQRVCRRSRPIVVALFLRTLSESCRSLEGLRKVRVFGPSVATFHVHPRHVFVSRGFRLRQSTLVKCDIRGARIAILHHRPFAFLRRRVSILVEIITRLSCSIVREMYVVKCSFIPALRRAAFLPAHFTHLSVLSASLVREQISLVLTRGTCVLCTAENQCYRSR